MVGTVLQTKLRALALCSLTRATLFGEQAPTLGTASLASHLREPCGGPAPYVPCYKHPQGNAS
jgi:hypothetical protein